MNDATPYLIISADTHAELPTEQYREYIDPEYREDFEAFLAEKIAAAAQASGFIDEQFAQEWFDEHGDGIAGGWDVAQRDHELDGAAQPHAIDQSHEHECERGDVAREYQRGHRPDAVVATAQHLNLLGDLAGNGADRPATDHSRERQSGRFDERPDSHVRHQLGADGLFKRKRRSDQCRRFERAAAAASGSRDRLARTESRVGRGPLQLDQWPVDLDQRHLGRSTHPNRDVGAGTLRRRDRALDRRPLGREWRRHFGARRHAAGEHTLKCWGKTLGSRRLPRSGERERAEKIPCSLTLAATLF